MKALSIAATGMLAQQLNVEVISNNLANMTTTGYKKQRAEFKDLLYQDYAKAGAQSAQTGSVIPTGIQIGLGVKTGSVYRNFDQGALTETKNNLDIAIQGKGYLQVELPSGEIGYTRSGALALNGQGEVVTQEGYKVTGFDTIDPAAKDIKISPAGVVEVSLEGNPTPQGAGTIELASFINPNGLEAIGDNLFTETAASGQPTTGKPGADGFGTIQQRFLESSNVDPVKEITDLIVAQRSYEMNSKVISAGDEMMRTATQLRG